MADLGNLFFSLGLDTKDIDTAWDKALKKYGQKAQVDLKLNVGDLKTIKAQYAELNAKNKLAQDTEYRSKLNAIKLTKEQLKSEEQINTQKARTAAIQDRTRAAIHKTNSSISTQHRLMQNLHTLAASYVSIFAAGRLLNSLIQISGEFETQKIALRAILQDLDGANKIYDQIKQLAVKSPFQFKDLVSFTKQLSAFSVPMNELYDTTKMLADVSAGLGVGMDRLVLAYGQIRAASVLRGQELRQLTEAGIPVIEELKKKFAELGEVGLTSADIFDKISQRLVPFEMIKEMFEDMTSAGGKFFNMQEVLSQSLTGKISNLKDAYQIMMSEIGESNSGILKGSVDTLRSLVTNYETVGKVLTGLILTIGTYKAGLIVLKVVEDARKASMITNIILGKQMTVWQNVQAAATDRLTAAYARLNAMMAKNKYALIAAAVVALTYAIYKTVTAQSDLEKSLDKLSNTHAEHMAQLGGEVMQLDRLYARLQLAKKGSKEYYDARAEIEKTYSTTLKGLKNEQGGVLDLADAYDILKTKITEASLQKGFEAAIEGARTTWTGSISEAISEMNKAVDKNSAFKKLSGIQKEKLKESLVPIIWGTTSKMPKDVYDTYNTFRRKNILEPIIDKAREAREVFEETERQAIQMYKGMSGKSTETTTDNMTAIITKNKEFWEEQKKNAEAVRDSIGAETIFNIKAGKLEGIKPETVNSYKKAVADIVEADKMLAAYGEGGDKKKKARQEKEQEDAIRLLQQRLDYLEKVKKAYQDLVATLGAGNEDIAARFVNNLFGTTFTTQDFGTNFKSTIEPIIGQLSLLGDKGKEAADKMRISLDEAMKSDAVKEYTDTIKSQNRAREDANKLLTEQMAKEGDLNRLIEERDYKMSEIADTEENAAELRDAIFNDYKQKILEIGKEWLKTLGLEGDATDFIKSKIKDIIPLFKSIDKLNLSELRELSNMLDKLQIDPKTLEFLKLFGIDVEKLNEAIKNAAKTTKEEQVDPEKWKRIVKYVNMYADALSDIGQELESMGGAWGEIGGAIVGVVSNAQNLVTALDDGAKKEDKIGAGLSALSSIIVMFINQAEKNKQVQEDWNLAIMEGAHQMSLMRIEAEAYKEANLFGVENPYAKAIAGAKRYAVAMEELNKIVAAGNVQTGTKKVVSGKNVATGAGAGAAIGAVVGTVIPVIGNLVGAAVGAGVGAIVGLFATKTVPIFESLSSQYGQIFNEKFELNPEILANYKKLDEATKQLVDNWEEIRKKALEAEEEMRATFKELAGDMGSQLSDALVNAFRNGDIYSAVDDYKQYVSNVIGDIISQLIFAAQFGKLFDELEQRFNESFKAGGDQDIVDDIMWFTTAYQDKIDDYNKAMEAAQKTLGAQGIDVFKPEQEGRAQSSTLGGAIQSSVTENTANLLGGYINGIRADGAKRTMLAEKMLPLMSNINDTMGNGLAHLAAISSNTFRSAVSGEAILEKLNALTTPNGATKLNAVIKAS